MMIVILGCDRNLSRGERQIKPVEASPLLVAIAQRRPFAEVERIVKSHPRLVHENEGRSVEYGGSPLVSAAYLQETNVVRLLIRYGANTADAVKQLQSLDDAAGIDLLRNFESKTDIGRD